MKWVKYFESFNNSKYQFAYNCVSPSSKVELNAIIDNMYDNETEVSVDDFLKNVSFKDIKEILPYKTEQVLKDDYHIKYYIGSFYYDVDSEFNKEIAEENNEPYIIEEHSELIQYAVIVWSAIEYVFKK